MIWLKLALVLGYCLGTVILLAEAFSGRWNK